MPTYQYACTECDERLERVQGFTDAPLSQCPVCGGRLRKVFSAVGVVFKGSGFYKNDSRGKEKVTAGAESSSDKGPDSRSEKGPDKAGEKSSEKSPNKSSGGAGTKTTSAPAAVNGKASSAGAESGKSRAPAANSA